MCRCGIVDPRALRNAMGLTQRAMAELLCVTIDTIRRWENNPAHYCPHRSCIVLLYSWLQDPILQERMARAGYPVPEVPIL